MNRMRITAASLAASLVFGFPLLAHADRQDGARGAGAAEKQSGDFGRQRLEQLKAELNLNPQQELRWQALAGAIERAREVRRAAYQGMKDGPQTAPDRLDRRIQLMQQELPALQAVSTALRDLYGVLTAEQKAILDQRFARRGGHGHRESGQPEVRG